jgi:hypothetical protein
MTRFDELDAISRERSLTEAEVDALYKALVREKRGVPPSRTPMGRRERYQRCKDVVNARKRERYANDPEWRERKRASARATYLRRKAKQCASM